MTRPFAAYAALLHGQNLTSIREKGLKAREVKVHAREVAAIRRESRVFERENLIAIREREISDLQKEKASQEDLNEQLRQANEHLVVASIRAHTTAEKLEQSKEELTRLANLDFLTNLPNRMQLYERMDQSIASAQSRCAQLAVIYLDLDKFKAVNDSMGHAAGDELLRAVGHRLTSTLRSSDTVSRPGGDEFVLLILDSADKENLTRTVKKILRTITAPYMIAGTLVQIGASMGISTFPEHGKDTESLIRNADAAMYAAKQRGRSKYQFFNPETMT